MLDARGGVAAPLYQQVLGTVRQRIVDGAYAGGERLGSEDELAAEFGVSRATIRQAVGELVREGLVSRKQGRGTFVSDSATKLFGQRFRGSLADLLRETQRAKVRHVEVVHDVAMPERIAAALGLHDALGTIVRRTRTMNDQLFAYTVNYLPPTIGRLVSVAELKKSGLMTLLARKGIHYASAQQLVRAQLADVDVCRWLELDFGAPVLFVERTLTDVNAANVEFVQTWYRGDRYEYTVTLDLGERKLLDLHDQLA